ncbi:ANTAR domain-containing protein [Catenulispora pinisilvae]|uniref:ANTAR domain-containing protein n=1 Tax=Catenulispora pinisilvae TaxID=2705253 RepID=UPI0018913A9A|nr:ANTAR domain-containing protein [Catenulispora pinisilvae]
MSLACSEESGAEVVSDRMAMVLAQLDRGGSGDGADGLSHLASSTVAVIVGVDGMCAGVGTGPAGTVPAWGGEAVGTALEDLQFTLGEGPSRDAVVTGVPVLTPDLADALARWPAFTPAAMGLGARALFVFPLRIGAIGVGTMLAHRRAPGALAAAQIADALALADAVTLALLHRQWSTPEDGGQPGPGWAQPVTYRAEVHQATGMVSVQLEVNLAEALVRLRARAWAEDRPLADVAADVVARRLRFNASDR